MRISVKGKKSDAIVHDRCGAVEQNATNAAINFVSVHGGDELRESRKERVEENYDRDKDE